MTLQEIKALPDDLLTRAQIEKVVGSDQQTIRMQARERPELLGFPVICIGTRVKIPRIPFLKFMGVEL